MVEYYRYLWYETWPVVLAFLFLSLFIILRLAWKVSHTWYHERDAWGFFVLSITGLLWAAVLIAYIGMFVRIEPDWFSKPGILQGEIREKTRENQKYVIKIESLQESQNQNELSQWIYIDLQAYLALKVGDQVKITYLPVSREAMSCKVLDQKVGGTTR